MDDDSTKLPRALAGTRYSLLSPLGEGAMGEVFLGEHGELGKKVVIKLLRPQLAGRVDLVARMRQEARLLAQIRHPALVDIYDLSVSADGRPFFVMEYVEGYNLRVYLAAVGGRLAPPNACELVAQVLDGLDAAHARGIVHRDVKPENLLVGKDGGVKILDFGVAKVLEGGDPSSHQTAAGFVIGTPRYMAPEQARGEPLSASADLYAVGCVLYELLAGVPPFSGHNTRDVLNAHLNVTPSSLATQARSFFDPELEDVVAAALKKDPRNRPPSAAVFALQLRRISARLTGKTTSLSEDKPTMQMDLHAAAVASARAIDPVMSTTTSPVSAPAVAAALLASDVTVPAPAIRVAEGAPVTTVVPSGDVVPQVERAHANVAPQPATSPSERTEQLGESALLAASSFARPEPPKTIASTPSGPKVVRTQSKIAPPATPWIAAAAPEPARTPSGGSLASTQIVERNRPRSRAPLIALGFAIALAATAGVALLLREPPTGASEAASHAQAASPAPQPSGSENLPATQSIAPPAPSAVEAPRATATVAATASVIDATAKTGATTAPPASSMKTSTTVGTTTPAPATKLSAAPSATRPSPASSHTSTAAPPPSGGMDERN